MPSCSRFAVRSVRAAQQGGGYSASDDSLVFRHHHDVRCPLVKRIRFLARIV